MISIQRDGITWPLETFLDAYGFKRIDGLHASIRRDQFALDRELEVVIANGTAASVIRRCGRHVDWHDAIAVRVTDGMDMCEACGDPFEPSEPPIYASHVASRRVFMVNSEERAYCDDCLSDGEWDY
jgi:hypothetical protein